MTPPRDGRTRGWRTRARLTRTTAILGCIGVLAACGGSRVAEERVIAAEGGGPVTVTAGGPGTAVDTTGALPAATTGTVAEAAAAPAAGAAAGGSASAGAAAGTAAVRAENAQGATGPATSGGTAAKVGAACTKQGPPIILGQVVEYSGLIGANIGSAIPVMQAWVKWVNDNGGIACHPVQLMSRDSASDPAKAASAVNEMVEKGAIAMVANYLPLSIAGFKSAVDARKVPAVGGDLMSATWSSDPLFYPIGTGFDAMAVGSAAALAASGADKIAIFYCIEGAVCPASKDETKKGAASSGYTVVYDVQVSLTQPDFTAQCQSAKNAGATAITMIVDGSAVSRIARSCAQIGYFPKLSVASLGATFDQNDPNVQKDSLVIASASADWYSTETKGQQVLQAAMKRYLPSLKLNGTAPLAWANGMMFKVAVEKMGAKAVGVPITTQMLRESLATIQNETLDGLIKPNSFSKTMGNNPSNPCYFALVFSAPGHEGKWSRGKDGCAGQTTR